MEVNPYKGDAHLTNPSSWWQPPQKITIHGGSFFFSHTRWVPPHTRIIGGRRVHILFQLCQFGSHNYFIFWLACVYFLTCSLFFFFNLVGFIYIGGGYTKLSVEREQRCLMDCFENFLEVLSSAAPSGRAYSWQSCLGAFSLLQSWCRSILEAVARSP